MARAASLPDDVLQAVAKQVGGRLPGVFEPDQLRETSVELSGAIEVWLLETNAIIAPTNELRELARPMGRLHHQVLIDGKAQAYARSTHLGAELSSWQVAEVFRSELAEKIEEAIEWIDLNINDDWLVRLMIVPAYQTHAFWLISDAGESKVLVVDCPTQFTQLRPTQLLSEDDFLKALRREQHIVGRIPS